MESQKIQNMSKQQLEEEITLLDKKIADCKEKIADLENNSRIKLFKDKELQKYQDLLAEYLKIKELYIQLLEPYKQMDNQEKLQEKNEICKLLIEEVSKITQVRDKDNNLIDVSEDIKIAFIEEIKKYMDSGLLNYTFYEKETDNWIYSNSFSYSNRNIDFLVTIVDFTIGAKQHLRLKTIDEMLCTFMLHFNPENEDKKDL